MSSRGTGLTLMGIVVAIIGYIMFQSSIGLDTKVDDIQTILSNSHEHASYLGIAFLLISVGLIVHLAGMMNTRGTAAGTAESLGIFCIAAAIFMWVINIGFGFAAIEMGTKFVEAAAGAQAAAAAATAAAAAGDAATAQAAGAQAQAAAAGATGIIIAGGFNQAASVAGNVIGSLLAGIGWLSLGMAYRNSDAKGAISFLPLGWLAMIAGIILLVANLVIINVVADGGTELASQISGISFILIVIWSVSRGLALMKE